MLPGQYSSLKSLRYALGRVDNSLKAAGSSTEDLEHQLQALTAELNRLEDAPQENRTEIVALELVVACGNRAVVLQSGKGILNQMSDFIKIPVHIFVLLLPVAFVGNIGFAAFFLNLCAQFVRIVALVRADSFRFPPNLQRLSVRARR